MAMGAEDDEVGPDFPRRPQDGDGGHARGTARRDCNPVLGQFALPPGQMLSRRPVECFWQAPGTGRQCREVRRRRRHRMQQHHPRLQQPRQVDRRVDHATAYFGKIDGS